MFTHPDLLIDMARQHTAELIDEANKQRLAARIVARQAPSAAGQPRRRHPGRDPDRRPDQVPPERRPVDQGRKSVGPAGRLEPWEKPEELAAGQAR